MKNNKNKTWLCDNCLSYNIKILNYTHSEMDVYCMDCGEQNYKVSEWFIKNKIVLKNKKWEFVNERWRKVQNI